MRFLLRFLPSITAFKSNLFNEPQSDNFSDFRQTINKNYFNQTQLKRFINLGIANTIARKYTDDSNSFYQQIKSTDFFTPLVAYSAFARSYINSNPSGHLVSVGGGPRGAIQFNAEVDFLKDHMEDFEKLVSLGANYNMQTTIIEKQGPESITGGVAWTETFGAAMMNTGAEAEIIARLRKYIEENKEMIERELQENPVAYATFKRAERANHIFEEPLNRALVTRRVIGRELKEHFKKQAVMAKMLNVGYMANVICDTTVKGIDISNPLKPIVVSEGKEGIFGMSADIVRMNIGTVTHCATEDKDVQKLTYWGPMFGAQSTNGPTNNTADLTVARIDHPTNEQNSRQNQGVTAFLNDMGLTDSNDQLKNDATLLVGGSGLSLYDQILALQHSMGLFETVQEKDWDKYPLGYKVSETAIEKYVKSRKSDIPPIVVVSRTPGKWIAPRHSHGPWWRQVLPGEDNPSQPLAGDAKIQHALFLHGDGGYVFDHWKTITDGAIAAYCGIHPDELHSDKDTYALLKEQYGRSIGRARKVNSYNDDLSATRTLEGACRQAYLASILGFGMEAGPGPLFSDDDSLVNMAPLTAKGRLGYLMHRAQLRAISNPATYKPTKEHAVEQRNMLGNFGEVMNHVTSSPIEVHSLMQMLIDAELAAYLPVDYANIKNVNNKLTIDASTVDKIKEKPYLDRVGGAEALKAQKFDAFIVSAIFYGKPDVIAIADARLGESSEVNANIGSKPLTLEDMESLYLGTGSSTDSPSSESKLIVANLQKQVATASDKLKSQLASIESQKDTIFNIYVPDSGSSVGPNRRLTMKVDGKTKLTSIELNALLGKGVSLKDAVKYTGDTTAPIDPEAMRMKADIFATDVNNRESITNLVRSQANYRFALEHLRAAGIKNPQEELERFYAIQNLCSESLVDTIKIGGVITIKNEELEYTKEVKQFEPYFNAGRLAAAYISAITKITNGNADEYVALYKTGREIFQDMSINFDNFEDLINSKKLQNDMSGAIISHMKQTIGKDTKFLPRTAVDFFSAFVDYPEHVHDLAYQWAIKSATQQLNNSKNKSENILEIPDPDATVDMELEQY